LLKDAFVCAVLAVSFVSKGAMPVSFPLIASQRQTNAAINGVTFLCGGFL
jgi:hypothetical protein